MTLPAVRAAGGAALIDLRPDITISERRIAGPKGAPDLTLFVVNADGRTLRPAILHMHGGGFVLGSVRPELRYLQDIAAALDCVIVSVEYRLAPETAFAESVRSDEHTSELQSLIRTPYAVVCLNKKNTRITSHQSCPT